MDASCTKPFLDTLRILRQTKHSLWRVYVQSADRTASLTCQSSQWPAVKLELFPGNRQLRLAKRATRHPLLLCGPQAWVAHAASAAMFIAMALPDMWHHGVFIETECEFATGSPWMWVTGGRAVAMLSAHSFPLRALQALRDIVAATPPWYNTTVATIRSHSTFMRAALAKGNLA